MLPASFTANTAGATAVTVGLGAANSVVSVVCTATPCSWTGGTGFTAGHSLLWTSDAGNGGSGPVTLTFSKSVAGAGALIQADLPGAFTAQLQAYNGSTLLATYTQASDTAGDAVYLGIVDSTGANISKVVYSLTACKSICNDFGLDTVAVNKAAAAAPAITLSPTSIAFPNTAVGATSAAQVITVKNTGTAAATLSSETVTGTNVADFIKSSTNCSTSLAAGASCTVSVQFKPASAAAFTANLSVADNASGSPQLVKLTGTGTSSKTPTLSITPTSISFPATIVGATSDAQTVTVKNTSSTTVNLTSIATGNAVFLQIGTCGKTLAAGASCSVYVAFKPSTAGSVSSTLNFTDNASGSPQHVTLAGTGTTAPSVKLSTNAITFPTTLHGTTSAAVAVTLTNSGTATLTLNSITVGGTNPTDFEALDTCGSTLAASTSCTVYVAFKPAATGTFHGTLSIADNGASSPQSVALTGTGN